MKTFKEFQTEGIYSASRGTLKSLLADVASDMKKLQSKLDGAKNYAKDNTSDKKVYNSIEKISKNVKNKTHEIEKIKGMF